MQHTSLLLPLASLILCATAAAATEPAGPPAADPAKTDKVVCKREVIVGSRLPGPRICRTVSEWKQERRDSQDMVEKLQRNTRGVSGGL